MKESGIKTFAFIGPVMPFSSLEEIEEIVFETKNFADEFYFDRLNLKPGLLEKIKLMEEYKELKKEEMEEYYKSLRKEIEKLIEKNSLKAKILF